MGKQYEKFDDKEVIMLVRKGDNDAMDYLLKKYNELVKKETRSMYIMGGDREDATQEGMIGLFKAIRDYDTAKNDNFYTFAKLCIERQLFSAVTASNRKKHGPLNGYISLYNSYEAMDEEQGPMLKDILEAGKNSNPEEAIIDKEQVARIESEIDAKLSKLEKQVLSLYMKGLSYNDIANGLGKPIKSIDNAVQRIRSKLSVIQ